MGISHEASEARLLTKQGRQGGHQGLWYHTHLQMVTEAPISCYPVTKKVPCSLQPSPLWSFLLVPPPSLPSSQEKERKQKVLGLHHCLHHCDNLHIYLVIFPLFCLLLQSISPSMLCAAETGKEVQVVISEMTDFMSTKCHIFLVWKSLGKRGTKGQVWNFT